jgi:SAM-dependent methyltransferase
MELADKLLPKFVKVIDSLKGDGGQFSGLHDLFSFGVTIPIKAAVVELPGLAQLQCELDSIYMTRKTFLHVAARTFQVIVANDPSKEDVDILMQYRDNVRNSLIFFDPAHNVLHHRCAGIVLAIARLGVIVDPRSQVSFMRTVVPDLIEAVAEGGLTKIRIPTSSLSPVVGVHKGVNVFCAFQPLPLDDGVVDCLSNVDDIYVAAVAMYRFDASLHKFLSEIRKDHDIDFSSLSLYQTEGGVQQFLEAAGLDNFLDAQRIVTGLKGLPTAKAIKSVVSVGEGFGFLAYHFKKLMPWVHFVGVDTSSLMRQVAKSFGNLVLAERPVDESFDLEILMNVVAFGVQPSEYNCIVLDNDVYFKGSGDFVKKGALLCRGDYIPRTIISQKRRNFLYTTPCHRGNILCQQEEVIPRAVNTIGATICSTKLDLEDRRLPVSDDPPTVQFIDTKVDHPGLEPDLPVYMVDRYDYLISPEPLGQTDIVIGLPPGKYSYMTTVLVNTKTSVPINVAGKQFGIDTIVVGPETCESRWYGGKMVAFHYHPVPTIKLWYSAVGRCIEHNCDKSCVCFKEYRDNAYIVLKKGEVKYLKAPQNFFYDDPGGMADNEVALLARNLVVRKIDEAMEEQKVLGDGGLKYFEPPPAIHDMDVYIDNVKRNLFTEQCLVNLEYYYKEKASYKAKQLQEERDHFGIEHK